MVNYNELLNLPSSDELPDSDDKPVDHEIQNLIPNLLLLILERLWSDHSDWFFGVDMGIFHSTGSSPRVPIVPDGFLSLGVTRRKNDKLRPSYVLWEENYIVPIFVLEIVSQTYGKEYDKKMIDYARLGVLYYVIYNPDYSKRDKHERFEVYRLLNGAYQRLQGNPVWMPEIGLGIGTEFGNHYRSEQEWLYWYDSEGNRFMTPEEGELQQKLQVQQERQRAEQFQQELQQERLEAQQQRQRAEQLEQMLRSLGVDPEQL
ncbi:MAG: Uma2 family endonuclease [Okeania sp. SIO3B5]|uniref:Uma2 family endonuclease n=1 Tax=Okeania sp. SIO3B5 TaxID=2607811 RepID=UPI0013FF35F3|nr:Uma2 family endonuclease [Okeania sp. SIO3B5]NEO54186.1 Uma2 family endonuclease [Okeania sp. SIO3B5]